MVSLVRWLTQPQAGSGILPLSRKARFQQVVLVLTILPLVLAGCSRSVDPSSLGADGQRLLNFAKSSDEVYAALSSAAQAGEAQGDAWVRARSLLDVFSSDSGNLPPDDAQVAESATFFVDASSIMLGFLQNADPNRAQAFFDDRVTTNYMALAGSVDDRLEDLGGSPIGSPIGSQGSATSTGLLLGVLAVVLVAILMFRQAQKSSTGPAIETHADTAVSTSSAVDSPKPVPADVETPIEINGGGTTGDVRHPELREPNHSRLRATDLRDVLEAAVSGIADGGWEVTLDSPDIKVMADPLRLRRLLGTLLLSATTHAPDHIGIVTAVEGARVILSIGDDGASDAAGNDLPVSCDPADPPSGVAHQLIVARQLAEAMGGTVGWIRQGGVSLYTVDLALADVGDD